MMDAETERTLVVNHAEEVLFLQNHCAAATIDLLGMRAGAGAAITAGDREGDHV